MGMFQSKKPKYLQELSEFTGLAKPEIIRWHRKLLAKYTDGFLSKGQIVEIYSEIFPQGCAEEFALHTLRTFHLGDDGFIDFNDFVLSVALHTIRSLHEKLETAFRMLDVGDDGVVTLDEMLSVLKIIEKLVGHQAAEDDLTPEQRMRTIFKNFDDNRGLHISMGEFVEAAMGDPHIVTILQEAKGSLFPTPPKAAGGPVEGECMEGAVEQEGIPKKTSSKDGDQGHRGDDEVKAFVHVEQEGNVVDTKDDRDSDEMKPHVKPDDGCSQVEAERKLEDNSSDARNDRGSDETKDAEADLESNGSKKVEASETSSTLDNCGNVKGDVDCSDKAKASDSENCGDKADVSETVPKQSNCDGVNEGGSGHQVDQKPKDDGSDEFQTSETGKGNGNDVEVDGGDEAKSSKVDPKPPVDASSMDPKQGRDDSDVNDDVGGDETKASQIDASEADSRLDLQSGDMKDDVEDSRLDLQSGDMKDDVDGGDETKASQVDASEADLKQDLNGGDMKDDFDGGDETKVSLVDASETDPKRDLNDGDVKDDVDGGDETKVSEADVTPQVDASQTDTSQGKGNDVKDDIGGEAKASESTVKQDGGVAETDKIN